MLTDSDVAVPGKHEHEVRVVVDGEKFKVVPKTYIVSDFKLIVGVPPQKELDQIIHGKLDPLADDASITIEGHEHFASHEKCGSSS